MTSVKSFKVVNKVVRLNRTAWQNKKAWMFWKWDWRNLKTFLLKQDQNGEGVFRTERMGIALVTTCFWGQSPELKKKRMQEGKTVLVACGGDSCGLRPVLNALKQHWTPQQVAPDAPKTKEHLHACLLRFFQPQLTNCKSLQQKLKISSREIISTIRQGVLKCTFKLILILSCFGLVWLF